MSSGHPRDYFNNLFCEWLIKANKDEVVKLMFLAFDLEDRSMIDILSATNRK